MSHQELRLGDHFPRAPKACARVAKDFFECFSEKGNQTTPPVRPLRTRAAPPASSLRARMQDKDAGRRGLAECASKMAAYDTCVLRVIQREPPQEMYRVQEEYRTRG